MAHLGGDAEAHARSKQYEYRANSSLVLAADTVRPRADTQEPTGEPESLWGKIDPKRFGDRVYHGKASENRKKLKRNREEKGASKWQRVSQDSSVLSMVAGDDVMYRPKKKETRAAYEALLSLIQKQFGHQPPDILHGAAYEVLTVLKNDTLKESDKKQEIEKLFSTIFAERFDHLMQIGKIIKDFGMGNASDAGEEALDDDVSIAVQFDEEEEKSDVDEVQEESDEMEEEGLDLEMGAMQMGVIHDGDDIAEAEEGLSVQDIDAYWLQRKVSQAFGDIDPQKSQKLAEEVLKLLAQGDDREVENRLVVLLEYDKFHLIKFLVKSRWEVVWCTRLARAEDDTERKKIGEEMSRGGPAWWAIFEQLHATRPTARERQKNLERSLRGKSQKLREDGGEGQALRRDQYGMEGSGTVVGQWSKGNDEVLDLDQLSFHKGGSLMANEKCKLLSSGSYRCTKKGYEEVHVPPSKPEAVTGEEGCVQITDMPEWAHAAFSGMRSLNQVQSRVYETALFTPENILLCAPTGSGKTNVALLAILREMGARRKEDGLMDLKGFKAVYVAPMKALVAEVVGNLSKRLHSYGVTVKEVTGDQTLSKQQIAETQIIVTTPEKWDIITRKSGDRAYITRMVGLLIIDEIHLLHDNRGPVLESIVARTVRQMEATRDMIRLVGLSATLPNYEDVALFLRVDKTKGLFCFNNSYRPCPLSQQYIGITAKKALARLDLMNEVCFEKVLAAAGKHQVLVFVHSRKETVKVACFIRDKALHSDMMGRFLREGSASQEILQMEAESVKSTDLRELLPYGFAIHHAGMTRLDRTLVEDLFADGHIQVLVSTATLAWGVNLPAHTVIIKGTQVYNPEKGVWGELSLLDVMQMLGRAGRPQFDTYGEGIVITDHSQLRYYLSLMNQQLPIESQFVARLADNLNAEIVLGTVRNAEEACTWLGYTYLYIRMLRNPGLYGISVDALEKDRFLEERRADLIHSAASILDRNNLIKYERKTGGFQVTNLGKIASFYYITHGTVAIYNEHLKQTMGDIELCRLVALSEEFKFVTIRQEEKAELTKLLERAPIPIRESPEDASAKINVLLQAYISRLKLEGLSLASDMVFITQNAGRLMRALFEIVLKRGWAQLARRALTWCKMVQHRMWMCQTPLRQFEREVGEDTLRKIERSNLAWERYADLCSQEIGELVRAPQQGKTLHRLIHQIPKLELAARVLPITRSVLRVELTLTPDFWWDEKAHGVAEPFWILVEDSDGERILHHEYFTLKRQCIEGEEDHTLSFTIPISEPVPPQYFIHVISDRWLGSETMLPVSFRHLRLPEKYSLPTELLDLQPLPVSALRSPVFEALYPQFKHFNPVQTQVFSVLYNTDENALIAAPTGSGKTVCAELAVMRLLAERSVYTMESKGATKCVYVAPMEAAAKERYHDWEAKFGRSGLGCCMAELTGDMAADVKILEKCQIIISTPERWDSLSRRWKQQKHVRQVSLFIVDDLHLMGDDQAGPVLEVIVSRMRYISCNNETPIRIVALSAPLANGSDVGEWLGASSRGLFNFSPGARPVPLDIAIQGVDVAHLDARVQAMAELVYSAIIQQGTKYAIVFVPAKKHARSMALELATYASVDGSEKRYQFLPPCKEAYDLPRLLEKVRDRALAHTLSQGVGFLHEGLTRAEQEVVSQLFTAGAIQVCVASEPMCWGMTLAAHLVVVVGTERFDAHNSAHRDYPVADILQMMGRATRPSVDMVGKCIVLCHARRKEYYKKFLCEPLPVESHLDHCLHDHLNAETVVGTIQTKQDAVDYLTWTFMYRRLTQNPNYYNLHGTSHRHLSHHLSELVENTLTDLEASRCIAVEDDMNLSPLNLGMIASYYYISYTTVERFSASLTAKSKMKGLLQILASASEYARLSVRHEEEEIMRKMMNHQRFGMDKPKYSDWPHVKAHTLLQAHFSRSVVPDVLAMDQKHVLVDAGRLLQAMVDIISSNGWLNPALTVMEMSQMLTQGLWENDSPLLQLPHFTIELAKKCQEGGSCGKCIETVLELMEMEEDERRQLLQEVTNEQLSDIVRACNKFPDIDVTYEVTDADGITAGDNVTLQVYLERGLNMMSSTRLDLGTVEAPRFPKSKQEGWWLVVGDPKTNQLLAIKRVLSLHRTPKFKLEFAAPTDVGHKTYTLFVMCDAYLGCDQEYEFSVDVKPAVEMDGESLL